MAPKRSKFIMLLSAKEHPETYGERGIAPPPGASENDRELLYPADVFETYDILIDPPGDAPGGWKQPIRWQMKGELQEHPVAWGLRCARRLPDAADESRGLRAERSDIRGINISEKEFDAKHEREATPAVGETDLVGGTVRPDLPRKRGK